MRHLISMLRIFLATRYKVVLSGQELLKKPGAKFILPNHQALVDPQIVFSQISHFTKVVPVMSELYFKMPVLKWFFKAMGAVPVSDITIDNRDHQSLDVISHNVVEALKNGKSVLLYPSGQIAGQGFEKIFNKQSAWAVTNQLPDNASVIAVRISGLWGSMWSRAWKGKSPGFVWTALKAVFFVVANLFLFVPKRRVTIEFCDVTEQAKRTSGQGRQAFNDYLEQYYNAKGEESVLFLKHFFYTPQLKRELPKHIEESVESHHHNGLMVAEEEVLPEVFDAIADILVADGNQKKEDVHLNANLRLDLNVDSLGLVAVVSAIESKFGIKADAEITAVKTVADLCFMAMKRRVANEVLKPSLLEYSSVEPSRIEVDGESTITDLLVSTFSKNGQESFLYDKMLGSTSRKEFLLKAYVVSEILKKEVDGHYVGIMLPALQSTTLLVAATYLAGKVPVMLNWTVGPRVMEHCIATVNLKQVITARAFFDKVADQLPDSVKTKCLFFEEKVRRLSVLTKLGGLMAYLFKRKPKTQNRDAAVVLFTSGSESLPKAVELTHRNILSDLHGSMAHLEIDSSYSFLSFLPPFHSFGFTVLTILPIVTGVKTAYSPDPTDSREVLKILKHTKASVILGTPTFIKMLLSVATNADLSHVRIAVSGAERLHPSVIDLFKQKTNGRAILLEGYGITECSPVLSINPLNCQKLNSVGTFIKGVEYKITDINTYRALPQGSEGMVMVRGDNVFNGYTDSTIDTPFVEVDGKMYYKTGDLGYVDPDGFLFITGRLKRFVKMAGEMISLPAIESVLLEKYGNEETTVLAVEGSEKNTSPIIALFATIALDLSDVNATLREAGFSSLVKVSSIVPVDEIPLLGTGKTDYKVLKAMI
jgi:acyl carrier protein